LKNCSLAKSNIEPAGYKDLDHLVKQIAALSILDRGGGVLGISRIWTFQSTYPKGTQLMYLIKMSRQNHNNRQDSSGIRLTLTFLSPEISWIFQHSTNNLCQSVKQQRENINESNINGFLSYRYSPVDRQKMCSHTSIWGIILIDIKDSRNFSQIIFRT
jgi:hypothetical protein